MLNPRGGLTQLIFLTLLAMLAFAANSLLCRLALRASTLDPASFTSIRLLSGALILWLLCSRQGKASPHNGNWLSSLMLFGYAAGFSFAYIQLPAATGALLLFGAVQVTMISVGFARGERLRGQQMVGLLIAIAGLVALMLPHASRPDPTSGLLMLGAGLAWGSYSLRAGKLGNPLRTTAANFARSLPCCLILNLVFIQQFSVDLAGFGYAVASGALASGLGYALWYRVLPAWSASQAASIQLSVPLIAALLAVPLLNEQLSLELILAGAAILGGIALVIRGRPSH